MTISEHGLDLVNTLAANTLLTKIYHIVRIVAKLAGGMVLLENDAIVVGEDLKRVLFLNVHDLAQSLGQDNATQLVYFSYYTGGFHACNLLFFVLKSDFSTVIGYIINPNCRFVNNFLPICLKNV
jgi:hypothetical protein